VGALPVVFGLAQAAGWTKERLAAEIDRQLGLPTKREQGWRSPGYGAGDDAVSKGKKRFNMPSRLAQSGLLAGGKW
jgi:hypothetical protein